MLARDSLRRGAMDENGKKKVKTVYTVLDRGSGKPYWMRVGSAYENKDGSINVKLDAMPSSFQFQIREWQAPREERAANGAPS
jgi:hypothetical protein